MNDVNDRYGGSGVCNILYPCEKCQLEQENVIRRQREEKNHYLQVSSFISFGEILLNKS